MIEIATTVYIEKGAEEKPQEYATWREWWEHKAGRPFYICSNLLCNHDAEVGAHVHRNSDGKMYIIPLCKTCSQKTDSFNVRDSFLVSLDE